MSSIEADEVCASCGKVAVDNIKLKICTACKLVKYCSVECQKTHRPQHKKTCKKRAAELRDDRLFTQPGISHLGECPLCCLPHSVDLHKSGLYSCCCKRVCQGCDWANKKRETEQGLGLNRCPFCREPLPLTDEEVLKNNMTRVKANDPVAFCLVGDKCIVKGDFNEAVEYYKKGAELGSVDAHYSLAVLYGEGNGVEKDTKKEIYHLEEAAIGGHPQARFNLGNHEGRNGRLERAMKHHIIAAKLGLNRSVEKLKIPFQMGMGIVTKEDYEGALNGHQTAVDSTKSQQREEAEKARQEGLYWPRGS